jgi:amidase
MSELHAELWRCSGVELAKAIQNKEMSCRELTASCFDRLDVVNPIVNAITEANREAALKDAEAADRALTRGENFGPLHGIPITTKENVDQAGLPTTNGVAAFRQAVALQDSPVVAHLRAAGAILIGRTNTPAFSGRWDTANALHGRTFNPWSRAHTAGGSSGGAASAVATGISPLAHGNDIGGSIRYPAYCCGVLGLRPTMGRVASFNATAAAERSISTQLLAVQGLLARTVADLRLGLRVIARPDARDPWWVPAPLEGPKALQRPKVGLITSASDQPMAQVVRDAITQAGAVLAEAGYAVEDVTPPSISEAADIWAKLVFSDTRHLSWPAMLESGDHGVITANALFLDLYPDLSLSAYLDALREVGRQRRLWSLFLDQYPILIGPNAGELPYQIDFDTVSREAMHRILEAHALMTAVNLLGLPALAVPTGTAPCPDTRCELPVGVQLIGAMFQESLLLDAAGILEKSVAPMTPIDPR